MTNYPYIKDLFTAVLDQSQAVQGRFHMSYRYGAQEINSDNLGEVLKEVDKSVKYPLVVMVPPHSQFKSEGKTSEWEQFRIVLFFCKTSFYNSDNTIADMNEKTRTSLHEVFQDWHDMKRCAINFIRALSNVQRNTFPVKFMVESNQILCIPFSIVGTDRVAGVRLDFDIKLFLGCTVEDYSEYPTNLIISDDSHPQHEM